MNSLLDIGRRHHTDKVSHGYLPVYDRYMAEFRDRPVLLLELGVRGGQSLRMWEEYLPLAEIVGLDINPDCMRHARPPRVGVVIGDQRDELLLSGYEPDIVLDDASHITRWTCRSFEILFPRLKSGGLYIIEDIHCYRQPRDRVTIAGEDILHIDREEMVNHPEDMTGLMSRIALEVLGGGISEFRMFPKFCILRKA